jgi:hypothetical protein
VRQRVTVSPNHAGKHVGFMAERLSASGHWVWLTGTHFPLRADSSFTAILTVPRRGKYRVRNTFRGDADHLDGHSAWKYFKVTG